MKTYNLTINGNKYSVQVNDIEEGKTTVEVNGTAYDVELDMSCAPAAKPQVKKVVKAAAPAATVAAPAPAAAPAGAGTPVKSPLPGAVLKVMANVGDHVTAGQHIILLEAMKMENNIDADKEGTIQSINVHVGDNVMEGATLFTIA